MVAKSPSARPTSAGWSPTGPGPGRARLGGARRQQQSQLQSWFVQSQSPFTRSMLDHLPPLVGTTCQGSLEAIGRWQGIGHRDHFGPQCGEALNLDVDLGQAATQHLFSRLARTLTCVTDGEQVPNVGQA